MRIYIVIPQSDHYTNLFVPELCVRLEHRGHKISLGTDLLWTKAVFDYDIVHIHWPEFILGNKINKQMIEQLKNRLDEIKSKGIPIVVQCHNLEPHIYDPIKVELYHIVYCSATAIIHMGLYSKNKMKKSYPNVKHVFIPHHIYDYTHKFKYNQNDCKRELQFPLDKINILCFGKFRNDDERQMILKCRSLLQHKNINFITPGFFREKLILCNFRLVLSHVVKFIHYKILGIKFSNSVIDEDLMEKYFMAADLVLIARKKILNSGNLPMAFASGKVVVGPDTGNVGQILKKYGNPVFQTDKETDVIKAIYKGISLMNQGIGFQNHKVAFKEWSSIIIAQKTEELYFKLKNENSR